MCVRLLAAAACSAWLATSATADPFSDLTKGGSNACFRRVYDDAHLRKLPRQRVTSITLWINGGPPDATRGGNIGLSITRRGEPDALYLAGDCKWDNFKGPPDWMPSFKKRAGAGCLTLAVPDVFPTVSSAEEGAPVVIDPAGDGRTMLVHLGDGQLMVKRARRGDTISVDLGPDDRVFRLARTDLPSCDAVKDAVTTMEPAGPAR